MKQLFKPRQLTVLGLLTAILLLMAYTPLGYLNVGPLAITFNVIPVALAAVALGPAGGAAAGAVFGLTSFLQCLGVGGASPLGVILFEINPVFTFILCMLPRFLDGLLLGYIFRAAKKTIGARPGFFITGFCSAFLNTVFFMSALLILFGSTDYMQNLIGGQNLLLFVCTFVGINAVCEMIASTVLTGAVGYALYRSRLLSFQK